MTPLAVRIGRALGRVHISLAIASLAALATGLWLAAPGSGPVTYLTADAAAIRGGQLWRLLTGPLVHVSVGHLLWDGAILLILAACYQRRLAGRWLQLVAVGLAAPTAAVLLADGQLRSYYGLSGLTHALAAAAVMVELADDRRRGWAVVAGLALAGKVAWGLWGPGPLVGPELASGVRETPVAHLVGVLVGALFATRYTPCDHAACDATG